MNPELSTSENTATGSKPRNKGVVSVFRRFDDWGTLGLNKIFSHYGLFLLLLSLAILHIANSHLAEYYVRETTKREQEVQQLRWYYMTSFAQFTRQTKQSEVEKLVAPQGLKPLTQPPFKLEFTR